MMDPNAVKAQLAAMECSQREQHAKQVASGGAFRFGFTGKHDCLIEFTVFGCGCVLMNNSILAAERNSPRPSDDELEQLGERASKPLRAVLEALGKGSWGRDAWSRPS